MKKQLERYDLTAYRKQVAGRLSFAVKRKLTIALCTIGNPSVLILDSPTAGQGLFDAPRHYPVYYDRVCAP